jgi:polysaccharide lyase-like protein
VRALTRTLACAAAAMAFVSSGAGQPPPAPGLPQPGPYWIGDFRGGDYCQYATIFEASSVNPTGFPQGYMPACPDYKPFARDPSQRVYLARRPAPPAGSPTRFVSRQELRTTDGPWFAGIATDKATIRLTSEQTLNGPFEMNSTRWFRFSFYLPERQFNWPTRSWYTLADLHNNVADPSGHDWPTISLIVTPETGKRRYVAVELEGTRAAKNHEIVRLLQLTRADGSRIRQRPHQRPGPFNRWHTVILGVRFSDTGTIGNSPGGVEVHFDGGRVYSKSRPNVWQGEKSVWLQLQNYKEHAAAFVDGATSSVIYFSDARIGTSYASVTQ